MWEKSFSLDGKVALVTGAGRGLGFEIARLFAAAGARVYLNGRNAQSLEQAVRAITEAGGTAEALAFDVSQESEVEAAFEALSKQAGQLDILVNNVGQRDRRPFADFPKDDMRRLLEIDLVGPMHVTRCAAPLLLAAPEGRIINITSIAGPIARAEDAVYTAAKGGLAGFTKALAAEYGPKGLTVNGIAPGYFATETNQEWVAKPEIAAWLEKRTALGRWGRPEEIAGAALFLASPAASYVTGQILAVDGGYLAHY